MTKVDLFFVFHCITFLAHYNFLGVSKTDGYVVITITEYVNTDSSDLAERNRRTKSLASLGRSFMTKKTSNSTNSRRVIPSFHDPNLLPEDSEETNSSSTTAPSIPLTVTAPPPSLTTTPTVSALSSQIFPTSSSPTLSLTSSSANTGTWKGSKREFLKRSSTRFG